MIGYFYWDPNPVFFTLPFVDHPIRWYGVLFAIGFFLAYSVALRVIKTYLTQIEQFSEDDVADLPRLAEDLRYKRDAAFVLTHLSKGLQDRIDREESLGESDTKEIVQAINRTFTDDQKMQNPLVMKEYSRMRVSEWFIHRSSIEELFKGAFHSIEARSKQFADILFVWIFLGTLVGARFGHVLFYRDPSEYLTNPLVFLAVWEGGLASHGALIGILAGALYAFNRLSVRFPHVSFYSVLDILALPVAVAGVFIRMGNFVNQEILGKVTILPWAAIFMHPLDGSAPVPRHPVQLYEALVYAGSAVVLYFLWRGSSYLKPGTIAGFFFVLVFGGRFFCEFFKDVQGVYDHMTYLMTGQLLSIPAILLGVFLLAKDRFFSSVKAA